MLLCSNRLLLRRMGLESRRFAESSTWDAVGNVVAWKLADALPKTETIHERLHLLTGESDGGEVGPAFSDGILQNLVQILPIWVAWAGLVVTWGLVHINLLLEKIWSTYLARKH